jgi:hypothetical protein
MKPFSAHSWLELWFFGVTPTLRILLGFFASLASADLKFTRSLAWFGHQ